MPAKKPAPKSGKQAAKKPAKGLTAEERAAMKEHLKDLKGPGGEPEVLAKIAAMPPADRAIATRLHKLIRTTAPELEPKTWYGMPAYAKDGSVVCFFQNASKFKYRYATLGFSDKSKLDDGNMWPVSYALMQLGPAEEARIAALVKKAVG